MNRRAKITIKAEDPNDAVRCLDQLQGLTDDRNIEVQLSRPSAPAASEIEAKPTIVPDEQLETEVNRVAGQELDKKKKKRELALAEEGKAKDARVLAEPKAIAKKRSGILQKLRSWGVAGYGFTIEKAAKGIADSLTQGH